MTVKCSAKSKRTGQACKAYAVSGADRCRMHLGRRVAEVKAEVEVREKANKVLAIQGFETVADPLTALQDLTGEVVAFKNVLGALVSDLEQVRYTGAAGEQVRAEIVLYERSLDRCGRLLGDLARLKIDERLSMVREAQARRVVAAVERTLDVLNVTDDVRDLARRTLSEELRRA